MSMRQCPFCSGVVADAEMQAIKASLLDLLTILQHRLPAGETPADRESILKAMRQLGIADSFGIIDRMVAAAEDSQ